jgi:predicted TIM-barrel fold metal-dependent hydrolase
MPPSKTAGTRTSTGPEGLAPVEPARHSRIAGGWDCHVHVFGPAAAYPFAAARAYTPPDALPGDLERMVTALGLDRFVLVQPSPYGFDNRRLLDALEAFGERARGVVVLPSGTSDLGLLREWHAQGVRGIRINLSSSALGPERLTEAFASAARAAAKLGWHIELHVAGAALPWLPAVVEHSPVAVVLDHFGRIRAGTRHERDDLNALERLLDRGGTWIKLSAPYRLADQGASRADIGRIARVLIRANPARLVWGSDWPHTGPHPHIAKHAIVPFRSIGSAAQLGLLHELVPDARTLNLILRDNPEVVYR